MNEGQEQEHSPLHSRITQARDRRASGWRRLLLGVGGGVLLAAVAGGGLWLGLYLARHDAPDDTAPPSASTPVTTSSDSAPPSSTTGTPPTPSNATPPPVTSSTTPPSGNAAADAEDRRARFQAALREFERTREVDLARINSAPVPGPRAARARIALNKQKALAAFDDGDADAAHRLLNDAAREAADVLRDAKAHYQRRVRAAKAAYDADDAETAQLHITQAREQWPGGADAKQWAARIKQLPEALADREKAERARAAGDFHAEQAALRRLAERDSSDAGVQSRLRAIDEHLREREFGQVIARGWRAVDDADPDSAARALAEAERRRPHHEETRRLKTGLAAFTTSRDRDRHLADAARATARDDWPAALRAFEAAGALTPTRREAAEGRHLASRVTDAQKAVDDFLSRPDRLGTPAVAEAARRTLRDAAPLLEHSPRLTAGHAALARAVRAGQTPVPIRVLSDNQTEIGIRGVGVIGRIDQRVIELRPGAYVFEGTRKGYRSKLVAVNVSSGDGAAAEVRVVCDERI